MMITDAGIITAESTGPPQSIDPPGKRDYAGAMDFQQILLHSIESSGVPLSPSGIPLEPVRLIHGPGQEGRLSCWNVDFFPPLLFATFHKDQTPLELEEMTNHLQELFPASPLLIQDRSVRPFRVALKRGDIPREMTVTEGGLDFLIHPERGQNPGFFPDMRLGRRKIGEILTGFFENSELRVLNLFAYTCSLSVAALAAGASRVVNIDQNKRSLDIGRRNHGLNEPSIPGGNRGKALFLPHDIFKSWGRLKREGPYHLIIADPPPSQKGSFDLHKDYPRLLRRLPGMLVPEGVLLLAMNHPGWSWEQFEALAMENLAGSASLERIDPPADFTPLQAGAGLKLLIVRF